MSTNALDIAQPGDELDEASLAPLRTLLNDQIEALDGELEKATTQAEITAILAAQARLATRANELTGRSVDLLAGEARITAEHIASAVDAANAVIEKVQRLNARLAKVGAVLDFAAAVLTGNGRTIVEGAGALKEALGQGA